MAHTEFNPIQTYKGNIFYIICMSEVCRFQPDIVVDIFAQCKCKLKVSQSIVNLMLEKDLVYSIQYFPNLNKSLQLLI